MTPVPPGWKCPRRVGFLFPHDCHRATPVGCPDCQNGQIDDPFAARTDRFGYSRYDYYGDDYLYFIDSIPDPTPDFTEADGADLTSTGDDPSYESDPSES
jgi:hypothetical protein